VALALAGCGHTVTAARPGSAAAAATAVKPANRPAVASAPAAPALALRLARRPIHLRFASQPASGMMFDLDTGEVLWRRAPSRVLPIASLTKIMTALVVVSREPPDAKVLVTKEALAYKGSGMGVLPRGKRIKLETMLNGLLLPSGNDAAIALAQRVSGTVAAFVGHMNVRAAEMGLSCTRYSSPDGFDDRNHSCALDLAVEARALLDQPRLALIVRRRQAVLPFPMKGGRIFLYNHNPLLRLRYPGTLGIKTGYTQAAGMCLVAAARRHGHRLGVVLLRSPDPATQARQLLDRAFGLRRYRRWQSPRGLPARSVPTAWSPSQGRGTAPAGPPSHRPA
jgi:D-alanyl-D-alanine carboxypeptidase